MNGHLEVLQWARAHRCFWDEATRAGAALNYFKVLEWARTEGCPDSSDEYSDEYSDESSDDEISLSHF